MTHSLERKQYFVWSVSVRGIPYVELIVGCVVGVQHVLGTDPQPVFGICSQERYTVEQLRGNAMIFLFLQIIIPETMVGSDPYSVFFVHRNGIDTLFFSNLETEGYGICAEVSHVDTVLSGK